MHIIEWWLEQYGYLTLFIGLLLEYIALPFPGELVMGYSGYLVFQGKLHLLPALLLSWGGTSIGMTVTYGIGRKLGYPFLSKFGPKFFLDAKKLSKTTDAFERYGSKLLFFSFFIPGVRHFTGYLAGALNVPYRKFAIYTYSGALFWVVTFLVGGRLLGSKWEQIHILTSQYGKETMLYVAGLIGVCLLYSKFANRSDSRMMNAMDRRRWLMVLIGGLFSMAGVYMFSMLER
ncbi:DedA family protein [Cohnella nanjingensis]|uniref:DedA family protein n=1 Tax=Cohnella nanjingensis TaxID=1387779 RepID=A0A7X0RM64_9BACL|nr:DedA family protein [Cohnella nanjingensis]MBB6670092.1 DedA family protein [Cohnella nanjingensis]